MRIKNLHRVRLTMSEDEANRLDIFISALLCDYVHPNNGKHGSTTNVTAETIREYLHNSMTEGVSVSAVMKTAIKFSDTL